MSGGSQLTVSVSAALRAALGPVVKRYQDRIAQIYRLVPVDPTEES